jgi:glutamine synthetase
MFKSVQEVRHYCQENVIQIIDFKVADLSGRWHHLSIVPERLDERTMTDGIGFDGSSYGFLTVEKSDMVFIPDLSTGFLDPFTKVKTLTFLANTYTLHPEPRRFESDPRYVTEKLECYMRDQGIADTALLGPEFEFHILDHVAFDVKPQSMFVELDAKQAEWNSGKNDENNLGFTVRHKGGYHVDLPQDENYNLRNEMVLTMEQNGIPVKYHHSEVGGPGQLEIELSFGGAAEMADRTMKSKYIIKNTAVKNNKTVTFMPKPFYKEAGNGMHVHMILFKDGQPLFFDENGYAGMSKIGLNAIGGLLKHAPALSAIVNPTTNSYKRLVPGYEAPVSICFALSNRSAVIRIPGYANRPDEKRFEYRSSDATCNPYYAYAALLMAAFDGIKNNIDPVTEGFGPLDKNIYDLSAEEKAKIKGLPKSVEEAADALEANHDFLLEGGVFTKGLISDILKRVRRDAAEVNFVPHPKEFEMIFDL